ncbi:transposase [Mangrovibacillus sp. Mu-81]|uniref:transposase n=1 Tax=Mangrovibacillus sp. Mu-81 TaxID=3121478 RepID=UPI002FE4C415
MARKARKKSKSGIYHVMMRGINKQLIFEDEGDKRKYLELLVKCKTKSEFKLFAFCLMDNHVHLLIKESEVPISDIIKRISSSYVYWFNKKYDRCGHLFQERFKSENVEARAYFLTVLRYIHQNCLKAGLASTVFNSKWTSIHEYYKNSNIIDTAFTLQLFSSDPNKAIHSFTEFIQQNNDDKCLEDLPSNRKTDNEVREYLKTLGIQNSSELQQMHKEFRNGILVEIKKLDGVTIRQLSRITGVSKSVIDRI